MPARRPAAARRGGSGGDGLARAHAARRASSGSTTSPSSRRAATCSRARRSTRCPRCCGASHFAGAITVARGGQLARLEDDPFARLFAPRMLLVEARLLGTMPPTAGPVIERYGSAQPWSWDRFPDG